jgi:hypothetical protein
MHKKNRIITFTEHYLKDLGWVQTYMYSGGDRYRATYKCSTFTKIVEIFPGKVVIELTDTLKLLV